MPKRRPQYLVRETTRHGKPVWYFRRGKGPRIRMPGAYDSEEFKTAYEAALAGQAGKPRSRLIADHSSIAWLVAQYMASRDWAILASATRSTRSGIYEAISKTAGTSRFGDVTAKTIQAGIDRRQETPHQAVQFLKCMRALFRWALKIGHLSADPTAGIVVRTPRTEGFLAWPEDDVSKFEATWPLGTRQRVALAVLLYTGLRRGDATLLGPAHVHEQKVMLDNGDAGTIRMISIKTAKTGAEVIIPILPILQQVLEAGPLGRTTFISTERGEPRSKKSFGNWFREACTKAGVAGSAHGLRKAGATRAANNGATERQLNAIFGWADGSQESAVYTRKADRRRLAHDAISKLMT